MKSEIYSIDWFQKTIWCTRKSVLFFLSWTFWRFEPLCRFGLHVWACFMCKEQSKTYFVHLFRIIKFSIVLYFMTWRKTQSEIWIKAKYFFWNCGFRINKQQDICKSKYFINFRKLETLLYYTLGRKKILFVSSCLTR